MSKAHIYLANQGEETAARYLENRGYKIILRNYKTKLGEIDIIARDKDTVVFVEVKTRRSDKFGLPQEAVSAVKQRQISKVALLFLKENRLLDKKARFDVVSILGPNETAQRVDLIQNAFLLEGSFTY